MMGIGEAPFHTGLPMIELIFIACLTASPSACEKRSVAYYADNPMVCAFEAQPYLARWIDTHPDWRIARWSCKRGRAA